MAAAAEAPLGSHQVLATKKYVLAMVISQITQKRTSPMCLDPLLIDKIGFPTIASTPNRRGDP